MMRNTLCLVAILLAACGDKEPEQVTAEEPKPDLSVAARADALKAQGEWEALGVKPSTLGPADQAWARAEQLRAAGDTAPAAAAYDESAKLYRGHIEQLERVKRAAAEDAYHFAIQVQAQALARRTQLDSLRTDIAGRMAAAVGFENAVLKRTLKACNEEVFSRKALLAIDTKLEIAKALFAGKRYEEASKSYTEAQAALVRFPKQCEEIEARSRAEGHRELTFAAAKRARTTYKSQNLRPPKVAQDAFEAAKRGEKMLAAKDYDDAIAEFDVAREGYDEAHEMAPVIRAERDEAERTSQAAQAARTAWHKYATREGLDPFETSTDADADFADGDKLLRAGDYLGASSAFRRARKSFMGLKKSAPNNDAELAAKQKGAAPIPPGKYASTVQRSSVRLGLQWLAKHQDNDGRWDADGFAKNDPPEDQCDGKGGALYDMGTSGLALLAFLGAGYADRGEGDAGYYALNVRRGLRFLVATQADDGVYGTKATHSFMYGHCMATQAMCNAYALTKDKRYKASASKAVIFIQRARNPGLAWRYAPRSQQNDTSITMWAIHALHAARNAGLEVDPDAFRGAKKWVDKMTDPEFGQVGYNMPAGPPGRPEGLVDRFPPEYSQSMTAAGVFVRILSGDRVDPVIRKGIELMLEQPPIWNADIGRIDMYYWYMGARALRQPRLLKSARARASGRLWMKKLHTAVVRHQHPKGSGSRTGSWDPIGVWGAAGGRIYSTAILTLALLPSKR